MTAQVKFDTCSMNVLTLGTEEQRGDAPADGLQEGGRFEFLSSQLHRAGVLLVGAQECRSKQEGQRKGAFYTCAVTAGLRGNYGCELWVAKGIPYAHVDKRPLFLRDEHVHPLWREPRLLLVRIQAEALKCDVVVVHAPSDDPEWIDALSIRLRNRPEPQLPLVILGDFNARLGDMSQRTWATSRRQTKTRTGRPCISS